MIQIRRHNERGRTKLDWLDSFHTFSFGDYRDPAWMGFGTLRVINEDRVAPGRGFGLHPHRDMEIITYVVDGALEHKDSLGNGSIIHRGKIQRMTAGTGIRHSEFNPSPHEPVHLLQIWVVPERRGLAPGYEEVTLGTVGREDALVLIGSSDGREDSVTIHQDISLFAANLGEGRTIRYHPSPGRKVWIQMVGGRVTVGDHPLAAGDGIGIESEPEIAIIAGSDAEFLLFDLI
jgi:quercetin 2,3-dioxygenase